MTNGKTEHRGLGTTALAQAKFKKPVNQNRPKPTAVRLRNPPPPEPEPEGPITCRKKFGHTCKKIYKKLGLKHLGFVIVLVAYSFLGAMIFHLIEGPNEIAEKQDLVKNLNQSALNLTVQIQNAKSEKEILLLIQKYQNVSGLMPSERSFKRKNWDLWGSMFYAGTVFTTIGYGHYAPATEAGRLATIIYALFGIPMVLGTLADLGKLFTKTLKRFWTVVVWAVRGCANGCQKKKVPSDDIESIQSEQAEEFDLPIPIAIGLVLGWLFICSAIFCSWEDWSYFKAFYFFFVSLSTIGLGDVTPDHPRFLLLCFPLVIMGLSLVSMVINLIQNKMEALKHQTADYLEEILEEAGLDTDSSAEENGAFENQKEKSATDVLEDQDNPVSLGIIQTWTKKVARRKRRGVQTEDSYLRDVKRRYPHTPYMELQASGRLSKSRDDINSLVDYLDLY